MKSIFGRMEDAGMIEQVPGAGTRNTAYREKDMPSASSTSSKPHS
jgi:hypothetical protein